MHKCTYYDKRLERGCQNDGEICRPSFAGTMHERVCAEHYFLAEPVKNK